MRPQERVAGRQNRRVAAEPARPERRRRIAQTLQGEQRRPDEELETDE
jgi:hypothetical protein